MFETIILLVLCLLGTLVSVALFLLYKISNEVYEIKNNVEQLDYDTTYKYR